MNFNVDRELTELRKRVFDLEHKLTGLQPAETVIQRLSPPPFIPWTPPTESPHSLGGPRHTGVGLGLERSGITLAVDLCDAWSGLEFTGNELRTALGAVHAWTADHAWDSDTLYVDVSEDAIYINAGTLPTTRGALTLQPATTSQRGLVLKRPWAAATYNANLLAIIDQNDDPLLTLTKAGDLESGTPAFVSGQTGWQITWDGNVEFNNAFIRGELHCTVFVADEMHATGGTLAVMTASKVAEPISAGDNQLLIGVGGSCTLVVQASWDTGLCYVADNHVLRIKSMAAAEVGSLDLWDIWLEVTGTPSSNGDRHLGDGKPGTFDVTCLWRQGGEKDLIIPTGAAVVHWGTIGTDTGGLILTSDLNYSPYMDIFTIPDATPWSAGTTPHVRVGNLDGVLSLGEEWGIAAGKDLSSATEPHIVMSDQRVRLWGVAQRWWDTSGNLRGEVDPSAGPTDELFWLGPSEAGAQFKVLGDGSVWASSVAISNDLGQWIFSKADGLLLLGPNCEITDAKWQSLRGQAVVITGALHQVPGRWLGTRALHIERATTNLVTNPSAETAATGYATAWGDTVAQSSTKSRLGAHSIKWTWDGAGGGGCYYSLAGYAADTQYTASVWVYMPSSSVSGAPLFTVFGDAWAGLGSATITTYDQWVRYSVTFNTGANAVIRPAIYSSTWQAGAIFYMDGLQVESRPCATSYCDGSLGHEYAWTGTAHASTSTRAETNVNLASHVGLVSGENTLSFRIVAQMPYDADGTWQVGSNNILMGMCGGADNNNRIMLLYNPTSDVFMVYINGNYRLNSQVQTFEAGDQADIVLTVDFTSNEYKLYLDGALVDTDTTSLTAPTITAWYLGTNYVASSAFNGPVSEYAVFGKVLSAAEVAAMYALQRPLVDAGSMDTPGIYILDGKFKVASSLTGNRIQFDAEEVAGYNSAGTKQFYIRASDGAGMFAGGNVKLDAGGATFSGGYTDLLFVNGVYNTVAFGADPTGPGVTAYEDVSGWKNLFGAYWNDGDLEFILDWNNLATTCKLHSYAPLTINAQGSVDITASDGADIYAGVAKVAKLRNNAGYFEVEANGDLKLFPNNDAYSTRGFSIGSGFFLTLDGHGGNTYFRYVGGEVKLYVDGVLKDTW